MTLNKKKKKCLLNYLRLYKPDFDEYGIKQLKNGVKDLNSPESYTMMVHNILSNGTYTPTEARIINKNVVPMVKENIQWLKENS